MGYMCVCMIYIIENKKDEDTAENQTHITYIHNVDDETKKTKSWNGRLNETEDEIFFWYS